MKLLNVKQFSLLFWYFFCFQYLRGGLGDCVFGFVFLMEASTPFVSLRGILSRFGLKSSKLYVVNGLVMLASFFICRVAMFPYVLYMYAKFIRVDYLMVSKKVETRIRTNNYRDSCLTGDSKSANWLQSEHVDTAYTSILLVLLDVEGCQAGS